MKYTFILLGIILVLSGCTARQNQQSNISLSTQIKACLIDESLQAYTDGSLTADGISQTAEKIALSCLKKLGQSDQNADQTTLQAKDLLSALMKNQQ